MPALKAAEQTTQKARYILFEVRCYEHGLLGEHLATNIADNMRDNHNKMFH